MTKGIELDLTEANGFNVTMDGATASFADGEQLFDAMRYNPGHVQEEAVSELLKAMFDHDRHGCGRAIRQFTLQLSKSELAELQQHLP